MKRGRVALYLSLAIVVCVPFVFAQRSLIDRIAKDTNANDDISVHALTAGLYFVSEGEWAIGQVHTAFNLTPEQQGQLGEVLAYYQGLNTNDKLKFFWRMEAAGILLEADLITKPQYRQLLGIAP